jgi:hypothetical protein
MFHQFSHHFVRLVVPGKKLRHVSAGIYASEYVLREVAHHAEIVGICLTGNYEDSVQPARERGCLCDRLCVDDAVAMSVTISDRIYFGEAAKRLWRARPRTA